MLEKYLNDPIAIWTIFFTFAAAFGALIDGIGRIIWKVRDLGRSWIITVPTTPGALARIERVRLQRGEFTRRAPNGDEHETFIAHGQAAYPSNRGPLHLISDYGANLVGPSIHALEVERGTLLKPGRKKTVVKANVALAQVLDTSGLVNLVAPTKEQAIDAETEQPLAVVPTAYARFRIWDPLTYWRATRENDMEDLYAAQREREHWAVKLAPLAIILFVVLSATMLFVLWKVMPLLSHAGG